MTIFLRRAHEFMSNRLHFDLFACHLQVSGNREILPCPNAPFRVLDRIDRFWCRRCHVKKIVFYYE